MGPFGAGVFVLGAFAPALSGCDIAPPEPPSFQTRLTVPLSTKTYTIAELVEDVESIVVDSTEVRIDVSGSIDAVTVDDELDASIDGASFESDLGTFALGDSLGADVTFGFSDLAPPGTPTGSVVVPPFAFAPPEREASGLDAVTSVTFVSGQIALELTNGLSVPISGSCDTLGLQIIARDLDSGQVLLSWQHPAEIPPGGRASTSQSLAGVTMGSRIGILVTGCSPGSGGQVVEVSDTDHVAVAVSIENAVAESATAEAPAQSFGTSGSLSWQTDVPLRGAAIQSGGTTITLTNGTELDALVSVRFPGFEQDGDTLGFDLPLDATATRNLPLDFAGATFQSGAATTTLPYVVRIRTNDTGARHVSISATDSVTVDVGPTDLAFAWISGVPDAIQRDLGPFEESVEWPEEAEGFRPAAATVRLEVTSEIGAAASGTILVEASSDTDSDTLAIGVTILPGALGAPVTTEIVLDETNSRILDLLAFHPTTFRVSGQIGVGDGATLVRIDRGAEIDGGYAVLAPFAFVVEGGSVELDPIVLELGQETRDLLVEHVGSATITARFVNGFPFGASVSIGFGPDSLEVFTSPELQLDPLVASSAKVDPVSGKTIEATESENEIVLDETEIGTLAVPVLFVGVTVDLAPSEGVVVVSPDDEVIVSTTLTVDVLVNEDLFSGSNE